MKARRSLTAVAVVAFLVVPVLPASGGPNVRIDREASADWFVPTGRPGHLTWYYAQAEQSDGVGDVPRSYVSVGTGKCVRKRTKNSVSTSCIGEKFAHGKISGFSMAPDASSAEMRFTYRGVTHQASWTAKRPTPGLYSLEEGCPEGEGAGGGIYNPARATGRIFGQRLKNGGGFWTGLSAGATASQCSFVTRSTTDDGRAKLAVKIPR